MIRRRTTSTLIANPVLVGAATLLVTIVAVFLAYNANNGLPFVPTTTLKVQLPNGANLVKGNEVRSGGSRVGVIESMQPVQPPTAARAPSSSSSSTARSATSRATRRRWCARAARSASSTSTCARAGAARPSATAT